MQSLLGKRDFYRFYLAREGRFLAILEITAQRTTKRHRMRMIVHPEARGQVEGALIDHTLAILARYPPREIFTSVSASHPEGVVALRERGFRTLRVLDQLVLSLHGS